MSIFDELVPIVSSYAKVETLSLTGILIQELEIAASLFITADLLMVAVVRLIWDSKQLIDSFAKH